MWLVRVTIGTFDFKWRCIEWSVYDIKVPRRLKSNAPKVSGVNGEQVLNLVLSLSLSHTCNIVKL